MSTILELAQWLQRKFGMNQPKEWERLSPTLKEGWLIIVENVPRVTEKVDSKVLAREVEAALHGDSCTEDLAETCMCGEHYDRLSKVAVTCVLEELGIEFDELIPTREV